VSLEVVAAYTMTVACAFSAGLGGIVKFKASGTLVVDANSQCVCTFCATWAATLSLISALISKQQNERVPTKTNRMKIVLEMAALPCNTRAHILLVVDVCLSNEANNACILGSCTLTCRILASKGGYQGGEDWFTNNDYKCNVKNNDGEGPGSGQGARPSPLCRYFCHQDFLASRCA